MNTPISHLGLFALLFASIAARGADLELVQVPETTVLAVAPSTNNPPAYAAAFGKLVGFYAQPDRTFKPVFPQMSLSLNGRTYSAIAIVGAPQTESGIEALVLPSCLFAHEGTSETSLAWGPSSKL